ncbi:Hypothetical predicted protein, partial [Olea europaea subsp. europaea]
GHVDRVPIHMALFIERANVAPFFPRGHVGRVPIHMALFIEPCYMYRWMAYKVGTDKTQEVE